MFIKEAKKYLTDLGYKIIKEEIENGDNEEEFISTLRNKILDFAEHVNFTIDDEDQFEAVMFEAYEKGMDMETAFKQVWRAVYVEKGVSLDMPVEESYISFLNEYRTKGALGKKTIEKMRPKRIEDEDDKLVKTDLKEENDTPLSSSDEFGSKWFKIFNKRYFNNVLKDVPVISGRMKSAYGRCHWTFDPIKQKIYTKYIELNYSLFENFKWFRNTLVHEMLHEYQTQMITEYEYNYANSQGRACSRKWLSALRLSQEGGHAGRWFETAQILNKKYPELNLQRYAGDKALENKTATGKVKKSALKNVEGGHVLIKNSGGTRRFLWANQELYDDILKHINGNNTNFPYDGEWTEYEYDKEQMALQSLKFTQGPTWSYKIGFFNDLCKKGTIKQYDYKVLGGEKGESIRKQRRKLRQALWGF